MIKHPMLIEGRCLAAPPILPQRWPCWSRGEQVGAELPSHLSHPVAV